MQGIRFWVLGFPFALLCIQKICVSVSQCVLNLMQNGHAVRHLRVLFVFQLSFVHLPPLWRGEAVAVAVVVVVIACSVAYRRLLN